MILTILAETIPLGFLEEVITTFISVLLVEWVLGTIETIITVFIFGVLEDFFLGGFGIDNPFAWGLLFILLATSAGILFYNQS